MSCEYCYKMATTESQLKTCSIKAVCRYYKSYSSGDDTWVGTRFGPRKDDDTLIGPIACEGCGGGNRYADDDEPKLTHFSLKQRLPNRVSMPSAIRKEIK